MKIEKLTLDRFGPFEKTVFPLLPPRNLWGISWLF
ncbi:hypothetical protein Pan216_38530 [Planctomycetes bacterium Pan216]|uniref:Uncharacterized protein n=1 Tax=Kolteria novifilia TaxID=2527975 RepID=A0A518B7M4_9BACT|nr:hypothetical protein Pan216_38530 [Planctomycetes bacterium Pan216]